MPRPNQSVFSNSDAGAGNAGTSGQDPVPQEARNRKLYPMDDPQQAMLNVLMDRGYNPFKTNPFMSDILGTAGGLANLFQLSNINSKATDINANGGADNMFKNFLMSQLSNGSIFQSLNQGAQNMPNYLNQIRGLQSSMGDPNHPSDPTQVPAFLASLENQLNSPKGFGSIFGSLVDPGLGAVSNSFDKGMAGSLASGWRQYLQPQNTPDLENPPNFFDYILGRR